MTRAGTLTVAALASWGCGGGVSNEIVAQKRVLTTSALTFDAGMVAVHTGEELELYLQSEAQGEVTIFDISVDDPDHWELSEDWKTHDCDGDGVMDCQILDGGGSSSSPVYSEPVVLLFKPTTEDEFRAVLTITSDDSEVVERDASDEGLGIWRVVVRGIGRQACAQVYPTYIDFGEAPAGGFFQETVTVSNCGVVRLSIYDFEVDGSSAFTVDSDPPIYVLPGAIEDFDVAFEPKNTSAAKASVDAIVNDPEFETRVKLSGNDCTNGMHPDCENTPEPGSGWSDDDGDGWAEVEGDCDDTSPVSYPDAEEVEDAEDNDCDGHVDEGYYSFDDDADGYAELDSPGDCDDNDPWAFPGATEDCDGRDNDCDGLIDEGEDDTPEAACAFVVEREIATQDKGGCSTVAAAPAATGLLAALALLGLRRREG